ncbi:aldo-keto reductase family 1 member C15-like isoform X2 [Sorex araneus]|uniref:aldo-keto reductase family 1 member C15-like isoform X2 n=1 Tax=Sorex araneus TaxID=42254 RepID=UPI002433B305|nr:aldo-keto reductase family 1 member C15-like isoform X2 [Sorex araneus]
MDLKGSWSVKLSDGHHMPMLGFGTYATPDVPKSKVCEATQVAIDVGFRHIDAAYLYENEAEVGEAMRAKMADGTVRREDLFYTTKVWATFFRPELVRQCLDRSLKKLRLDYVDLCLIHMPIALQALESCKDAGLTRSIGVSNFNRKQLEMILSKPGLKYKPVCNQVECHPYLNQQKLLDFCRARDIVLVAYSALGSQRISHITPENSPFLLEEPVLTAIAKKHGRSPGQVALRYQLQRGVVVLAKSFTEKRIKENFQIFDFELSPEDMKALESLNRNFRYFSMNFAMGHPNYPFADEY